VIIRDGTATLVCPTDRLAAIFRVDSPAALNRRAYAILRIGNRLILGSLHLLERHKATRCTIAQRRTLLDTRVTGCPGVRDRIRSESLTGCCRNP
jgi:hypothetical protein